MRLMFKRGFTLIEVLTVILIFGILVSITSYVYATSLMRSRDTQRKTDLDTIKNALEQFYGDNRSYPDFTLSPHKSLAAKVQLESLNVGSNTKSCASLIPPAKKYLAPYYLSTIPEDPKNKLSLSDSNCAQNLMGFYLYIPYNSSGDINLRPRQFYLAARMERNADASSSVPTELTDGKIGDILRGGQGTSFCTTTLSTCTQNYFLKNSNNN